MKINLLILTGLVLAGIGWVFYSAKHAPQVSMRTAKSEQNDSAPERLQAPNFEYITINGDAGSLSDHRGTPVLLHFWASWCAPCIVEFPALMALANHHQENLIILAVSTDKNREDIEKFIKRAKIDIPKNVLIIQDANKSITQDLYQTIKLPETYVIDSQQGIADKIIGPEDDWMSDKWQKKIQSLHAPMP